VLKRSIIGSLGGGGEKAGRHFPVRDVIIEAIAAHALTRAGFVAAVAAVAVTILLALH
jgi:hypothetical protein